MNKILLSISVFLFIGYFSFGQNNYWVFFTDKSNTSFDPFTYFDKKAIDRRIKNNLPLSDSTDFPLNEFYVSQVERIVTEVTSQSRWFNAVGVYATPLQAEKIAQLSFVKQVEAMELNSTLSSVQYNSDLSKRQNDLLIKQTESLGRSHFEKNNLDGKGIRIAVFDAGFPSVDKSPVFKHLFDEKRLIKTYDFARKKEDVYRHSSHGTMVLSCICGIIDGKKIGLATGAEFLLARTEVRGENKREEENWLEAVEWADKNGADIINSSLGYTYHKYLTEKMDGKTSIVARAANLAARKGILVVNSMGNDGSKDWKILCTPADADSVLSVGSINPKTGYKATFSSFGPTADMRMKPNLVAYGKAISAGEYALKEVSGTSFSSPLITGFAACAWQADNSLTNMELFDKLQESAKLYPYYDYAHGYGMPQASFFTDSLFHRSADSTFTFKKEGNFLTVYIKDDLIKPSREMAFDFLYYNIKNNDGIIDKYAVVEVLQSKVISFNISENQGKIISVHFNGFTNFIILTN